MAMLFMLFAFLVAVLPMVAIAVGLAILVTRMLPKLFRGDTLVWLLILGGAVMLANFRVDYQRVHFPQQAIEVQSARADAPLVSSEDDVTSADEAVEVAAEDPKTDGEIEADTKPESSEEAQEKEPAVPKEPEEQNTPEEKETSKEKQETSEESQPASGSETSEEAQEPMPAAPAKPEVKISPKNTPPTTTEVPRPRRTRSPASSTPSRSKISKSRDSQSAPSSGTNEESQGPKPGPQIAQDNESPSIEKQKIAYFPKDRPVWLESKPAEIGDRYQVAVSSGPWFSEVECNDALKLNISNAVRDFVSSHVKHNGASHYVNFHTRYIEQNIIQGPIYKESLQIPDPVGMMKQHHARLEFDQKFRDEVTRRWQEVVVTNRLQHTGIGFGGVIGLLMTVVLFFKLDTASKGYYTKRLKFAAQAVILLLIGLGLFLTMKIPWL